PTARASGRWEGERSLRHFGTGEPIVTQASIFSVCHPETGEPMGFATVQRDITERKRSEALLREIEARKAAILESALDGIIMIDDRGRIELFNPAAERLFGYSAGEVIGESVSLLMPSPDRERHDGYLARYLATGVGTVIGTNRTVTALRKDGSTF